MASMNIFQYIDQSSKASKGKNFNPAYAKQFGKHNANGMTPLMYAFPRVSEVFFNQMLQHATKEHLAATTTMLGHTVLHIAAEAAAHGLKPSLLVNLIQKHKAFGLGISPLALGKTPLDLAKSGKNDEIVQLLIKEGAKTAQALSETSTPLQPQAAKPEKQDNKAGVEEPHGPYFVAFNPSPEQLKGFNAEGFTLLMESVRLGNQDIVFMIIDQCDRETLEMQNRATGNTALHYAIEMWNLEAADIIVKRMVTVNADFLIQNKKKLTAMAYALLLGENNQQAENAKAMVAFAKKFDLYGGPIKTNKASKEKLEGKRSVPESGKAHRAKTQGKMGTKVEITERVLSFPDGEMVKELFHGCNETGLTFFLKAVKSGDKDFYAVMVFASSKEDLEFQNPKEGATALHYAIVAGFYIMALQIVEKMVQLGCDFNLKDNQGHTCLYLANLKNLTAPKEEEQGQLEELGQLVRKLEGLTKEVTVTVNHTLKLPTGSTAMPSGEK